MATVNAPITCEVIKLPDNKHALNNTLVCTNPSYFNIKIRDTTYIKLADHNVVYPVCFPIEIRNTDALPQLGMCKLVRDNLGIKPGEKIVINQYYPISAPVLSIRIGVVKL